MQVHWSPEAADDLGRIVSYIRKDSPAAAQSVGKEIYVRAGELRTLPHRGKVGRIYGTRELPLPPLPFIVYKVPAYAVERAKIIHGAQRRP